jgi:hypothetical protein
MEGGLYPVNLTSRTEEAEIELISLPDQIREPTILIRFTSVM